MLYIYRGKSIISGRIIKGEGDFETIQAVENYLYQNQVMSTSVTRKTWYHLSLEEIVEQISPKKIGGNSLSFFFQEMYLLLHAGVEVNQALTILRKSCGDKNLKKVMDGLENALQEGNTLKEAMEKVKCFPKFCIGMIQSGEVSGRLEIVLFKLSTHYESVENRKKKLQKALIYPIFLGVVLVGIIGVLLGFIIPQFEEMFLAMEIKLPIATLFILALSKWVNENGSKVMILVALFLLAVCLLAKKPRGKRILSIVKRHVPLVKTVLQLKFMAIFCETIGLLLQSGIAVVEALKLVEEMVENPLEKEAIAVICSGIVEGESLGAMLKDNKLYLEMVKNMVETAEAVGQLEEVLLRLGEYYNKAVENKLDKMMVLIEPLFTVLMAIVVGGMMMAILLPTFTMASQMSW